MLKLQIWKAERGGGREASREEGREEGQEGKEVERERESDLLDVRASKSSSSRSKQ